MLRDHYRNRKIRRQRGQHFGQSLRAASRNPNGHNVNPGCGGWCLAGLKSYFGRQQHRLSCANHWQRSRHMPERFDLGNKVVGYAVESGFNIRIAGFGDVVGGSTGERFQRSFRASLRARAEHYDGHAAVELADLWNGFEPVHLGHLDIEQNNIRTQLVNFVSARRPLLAVPTTSSAGSRESASVSALRTTIASSTISTRALGEAVNRMFPLPLQLRRRYRPPACSPRHPKCAQLRSWEEFPGNAPPVPAACANPPRSRFVRANSSARSLRCGPAAQR